MSALHKHIQHQQDLSCNLQGVIEAMCILNNEKIAPDALTSLLNVARSLIEDLNTNLDKVNLPEGGEK